MNCTKETNDLRNPALEVRRRLLGSQRRQRVSPEIRAARARLHALHTIARRHGWHNVDPGEIRAACRALDQAMHAAGLQLGSAGSGLRDGR